MASFLVETFVPPGHGDRLTAGAGRLRAAIDALDEAGGHIRHVRSYLVPRDDMGVHVIEADSADAVIRLAELAGIDVERIVGAIGIEPPHAVVDEPPRTQLRRAAERGQ